MILNSFDGMGDSRDYEIVNPVVSLGKRKKRVTLIVVKDMSEPIITPGLCDTMRDLDRIGYHIADSDIKSDRIDNIKILIGADFLGNYLSGMRQVDNVDLLESPGGYLIYGLIPHRGTDHIHCNSALVARVSVELGESAPLLVDPRTISSSVVEDTLPVHKLWDLDVVGIIPSQVSPNDVETISKYETTVLHRNGRYWVELPFKHNHPFLPTNYNVALGQMYNQLKRFQHQPDLLKCYDNILKEQLKLGFIEEVENPVISPNTHYPPHHAVRKNSSTTPLRVVYNCSAKPSKSSASLNDCLMTGPSLMERLFDLLVRFRMNKFACIPDIEKAFLQIGLQQHHRDFTRFLWLEDPFDENSRHNADNEQQLEELYVVANVKMNGILWLVNYQSSQPSNFLDVSVGWETVFVDASTTAYGAVCYLSNNNQSNFVASKARVTPLKTRSIPQLEITALQLEIVPEVPIPEPIFDYSNYSSLRKLLNVTRIVYNFIMCVKSGIRLVDPLVYWIRYVQDTHYPRICAFLMKELNGLKQDKLQFIKDIGLYYDESTGLIHSCGRLHHSNLDQSTKFPILIPSKCHLTNLLIDFAHEKCLHGGVKETLSYLRRQYWIPKVISTIKKFLRHCVNCKRIEGRRFDYPGPPPLPAGGFYERLIGLTKSCLKKVLFKKIVNADELETVLKEIQCKLNNRPLTHIDAETPIEPLAPIHLWCGRIINPMPSVVLDSQEDPNFLDHSEFNKRYSQVSVILNHFENMWRNEYLTALREKYYGGSQECQDKAPLVGDVVIVERPGPQNEWPLGRIVKLYPDKENIIRVVDVLYNGSISKRTIDKFVPLEIHSPLINSTIVQGEESQPNVSGETKQIHGDSVSEVRPLRKAALKAAKLRQYLIDNDQI
ncbi:uncharacterized protein [Palaemon carinicauda]|uniref:uncharacterized protein n=1 Tax=Palaemon carinicauda TaxID=392227 RepID=UPI0035B6A6A5